MMLPPMILRTHISATPQRGIRLWLPLFLLWPVVGIGGLILLPLAAAAAACHFAATRKREGLILLMAAPSLLGLVCALRGLRVRVQSRDHLVYFELL